MVCTGRAQPGPLAQSESRSRMDLAVDGTAVAKPTLMAKPIEQRLPNICMFTKDCGGMCEGYRKDREGK